MVIKYSQNGNKIVSVYWENINDKLVEQYMDYDEIQLWYPNEIGKNIRNKWGDIVQFIHFEQDWKCPSSTRIIALTNSSENIFKDFNKNTRYEIRRARERDHLKVSFYDKVTSEIFIEYEEFYNEFAHTKNLPLLNHEKTKAFLESDQFALTKITDTDSNEILVYHTYMVDKNKRVALMTSVSLFRESEEQSRINLIARANRLLHYEDMLYFKSIGIPIYDLGGVYIGKDENLCKVNAFKNMLGGMIEFSEPSIIIPLKQIRIIKKWVSENYDKLNENGSKRYIIFGYNQYGKLLLNLLQPVLNGQFTIVDNYATDNKIKIEKDYYLNKIDLSNNILICTCSINTYNKIKSKFEKVGFVEGENMLCCRKEE